MVDIEKDLLLNFQEFFESAEKELKEGRYNSAVSSYFKAIAILCDWQIYKERRVLPKNHTERFHFVKLYFTEAYFQLSPLFKKYTDSYNLRLSKEDALILKENVEKFKKLFKI